MTLHALLKNWACRTPEAVAIRSPVRSALTYSRALAHIEQTSEVLGSWGVGRNDPVAIVLPNGPEMALAFISVAASATFAPLNPTYRSEEFEFYLSDIGAKALIVQAEVESPARDVAKALRIPILELLPSREKEAGVFTLEKAKSGKQVSWEYARQDDVALLLHTSGTTSKPKLVPLTHANICSSASNIRSTLQLSEQDVCINAMPLFHIHGLIGALLSSLASGSSVVCPGEFVASKFFQWMNDFKPTWYTAVPAIHGSILDHAASKKEVISGSRLRFIRSSSAPLSGKLMASLEEAFGVPVIESYGMTEASHQMASNPLPPAKRKKGSVGLASGPDVAVMNQEGELVESGEMGEIVICGSNVTKGYVRNDKANEASFVNGWFRTGDEGYLDEDGYLFLTGRIKEIINRGGEKISPAEVDSVILDHPLVKQAVTFAVPDDRLGEDVAVAVVLEKGRSVAERELRRFAAERLADFKVPRHVIQVEDLPKGPTGKVQRIGMAERLDMISQDSKATASREDFLFPRTPTEKLVAQAFKDVLESVEVGAHDNFFDLGGDSLGSIEVLISLESSTGKRLTPRDLMFHGVAQLASRIGGQSYQLSTESDFQELSLIIRQHPFYFGTTDDQIFACYHELVTETSRKHGLVLCYPIGDEYIRSHRTYKKIADQVARLGIPVLRFDYFGTGDSSGNSDEGDISRWLLDIARAVDEIRHRSQVDDVYLLGLRLGATLATLAAMNSEEIQGLILWEPVVKGEFYADELRTMPRLGHGRRPSSNLRSMNNGTRKLGMADQFSEKMLSQLEEIDLAEAHIDSDKKILVIESREETGKMRTPGSLFDGLGPNVEYQYVPGPSIWDRDNTAIVANGPIAAAASWISKVCP